MRHLFIVGAQRSGTTFLANYLDAHPAIEIAKPIKPEPKFFLDKNKYSLGIEHYYATLFDPTDKTKVIGEKGTSYLERTDALEQISKSIPDARILILVRDPVCRAWSNYKFTVESGLERLSFEDALTRKPTTRRYYDISVNPFDYLARGHYIKYIRALLRYFDLKSVRIEVLEELLETPNLLGKIFDWLDVESSYSFNVSDSAKNATFSDKELSAQTKLKLQKIYKKSNEELEDLLGRKIEIWGY